ncbi:MAG: DNA polymerase III subunit delta', partial [Hyphomonadaceae bacterium]
MSAHPKDVFTLAGHTRAEAEMADALESRRLHHAWLITGPEGVGKATLAYRMARAALGAKRIGPRPLDVSPSDRVAQRIAASSHPDFFVLERALNERGKLKRDISAEQTRELPGFFTLAASEGGKRVAIVDAVDDLNRFGANALLKILEEPPPNTLLILICHAPGAALATIRSRCRRLDLRPLSDEEMKGVVDADEDTLRLAAGRPGRALALQAQEGLANDIASALKQLERKGAEALLQIASARSPDPGQRLALVLDALEDWIRRTVVSAGGKGPRAAALAEAYAALEALRAERDELDLDPT